MHGLCLICAQLKSLFRSKKTRIPKTQRDVRLLQNFLRTEDDERDIEDISAVELNEYICQFIISVHTKDGNEYKPT